jgi:hypothetical protein
MDDQGQWIAIALSALASLWGGWIFLQRLQQLRVLGDTPTSKIRSAAQGYTELYGVLQELADPALRGPLTGTPCVWWRYRIEEYQSGGKNSRWRSLETASSNNWLLLSDNTGECLINPAGAEIRAAIRQVWQGTQRHPLRFDNSGRLAQLLRTGRRYRYTEERLHAGEPLYAIGDFRSHAPGLQAQGLQALQGALIRQWKEDFPALLQAYDQDGSGQLEEHEWQQVRQAALQQAGEQQRQRSIEPARHQLLKPGENRPFILSSHGEDELIRRFGWQAAGAALLCLAGALALTWLLQQG